MLVGNLCLSISKDFSENIWWCCLTGNTFQLTRLAECWRVATNLLHNSIIWNHWSKTFTVRRPHSSKKFSLCYTYTTSREKWEDSEKLPGSAGHALEHDESHATTRDSKEVILSRLWTWQFFSVLMLVNREGGAVIRHIDVKKWII